VLLPYFDPPFGAGLLHPGLMADLRIVTIRNNAAPYFISVARRDSFIQPNAVKVAIPGN
jgi:hypothetical protein